LDSAGLGFHREKTHDDKCKYKNATLRHKNIEKHSYFGLFWFVIKILKNKIPEPHLLLSKSMKYVKKSGHGEEWVK
jgi:hypothetical protein